MPGATQGSEGASAGGSGGRASGAPLTGASASRPAWHGTADASLGPRLLRERREHAQVGEIFYVVVAGALGRVSGQGQHVLEHFGLAWGLV